MRRKLPHKHATPIQQSDKQRNQPVETVNLADNNAVTPADILHLQRTIGNNAVQRLLTSNQLTMLSTSRQTTPTIQRTGLRDEDAAGGFSSAIKSAYRDPTNAGLSIEDFLELITPFVVESLSAIGAPPLKIIPTEGDHGYASFDLVNWQIKFTLSKAFKRGNHVRDLSDGDVGGMINSLYHEARHAEQQFRVAQMLAGQKIPQEGDASDEQKEAAKTFIISEMRLRAKDDDQPIEDTTHPIIVLAVASPIYDNPDGDNQVFEEAQAWYNEVYGKDSMYRTLMLKIKDDIMEKMSHWMDEAIKELKKGRTNLGYEIGYIEIEVERLLKREDNLREELARIQAIDTSEQNANDVAMQYHLERLLLDIENVKGLRPITITNLREMEAAKISINKEVYAAYRDLPTEDDAWKTGNLAQSEFNETLPQFAE